MIAGQKPVITKARKSIATFKLRDGQAIGTKVTLRKARMYDFIDRLVNIALPRVRDFRGLNVKSFDGRGNYTIGIKEHIVFPEIDYDKTADIWGMDITICTKRVATTGARADCGIQLPFRQGERRLSTRTPGELNAKKSSTENTGGAGDKKFAGRRKRLRKSLREGGRWRTVLGSPPTCHLAAQLFSATRIRNRCEMTGRPRGYYRKHKLSRIALRDLGSKGLIPGLVKSSW